MKGIVFDIRRGVTKDGPGLRTSVFLKGCPLRCVWCHNPESQSPEIERAVTTDEVCGREMSVEEVMDEVRRDKVFYASSGGGVTLTGGEPMMQGDFAFALASAAHKDGIHVNGVYTLPPQISALVGHSAKLEEMAVQAAITGDPDLVFQAVLQDPLTASVCSMQEIHDMVQEMFDKNAEYLGYFKSLKI